MARTTYTDEFKATVVAEYAAGVRSISAICADYLLDPKTVGEWRIAAGVSARTAAPGYRPNHLLIRTPWDEVRRLYRQGLSDYAIADKLGASRGTIRGIRTKLRLPSHFAGSRRIAVAAIVLLLLTSGAQAQGWLGHGVEHPDPFASMRNVQHGEPGFGCCSGEDCAYTEQCMTLDGVTGVIGPDQRCHAIPAGAYQVRGCPLGQTSACFIGPHENLKMICACLGGS